MKKLWYLAALLPFCLALLLCGCGEKSATTDATVTLDTKELSLTVGDTAELNATAAECESVTWSSGNESIVTVAGNGSKATVTAVAAGSAEITVTGKDANGVEVKDTCTVTVAEKDTRLTVNLPAGKLILKKGRSATVKAFAQEGLTGDYVWESSDETVGTVEYQGAIAIVTVHKKGTCTITVHCGTASSSFELICGLT